jgi:hypothetical protein
MPQFSLCPWKKNTTLLLVFELPLEKNTIALEFLFFSDLAPVLFGKITSN